MSEHPAKESTVIEIDVEKIKIQDDKENRKDNQDQNANSNEDQNKNQNKNENANDVNESTAEQPKNNRKLEEIGQVVGEFVTFADKYKPSAALRHDNHYRIDPKRYPILRSYLRQDWNTVDTEHGGELAELRANWLELFFDLIYVAGIVHLSKAVSEHYHNTAFFFLAFAEFLLLFQAWTDLVMYETRFSNLQIIDNALKYFYMLGVMGMGMGISPEIFFVRSFAVSFAITRGILMIQYWKCSLIPRAKEHCHLHMIGCSLSLIFSLVIAFSIPENLWGFFGAYVFLVLFSSVWNMLQWFKKETRLPINVPHVAERQGLFCMLVLGESIISLLSTEVMDSFGDYAIILAAFTLVYCVQSLYFESQPTEEHIKGSNKLHAMRASALRGRIYMYGHTLLVISLLGLGIGMKIAAHHIHEKEPVQIDVQLTGFSLVVALISINVIRKSHPIFKDTPPRVFHLRIVCIGIMFILPFFWHEINNGLIMGIIVLITIVLVLADEESKKIRLSIRTELKLKAKEAHEAKEKEKQDSIIKSMTITSTPSMIEPEEYKTRGIRAVSYVGGEM